MLWLAMNLTQKTVAALRLKIEKRELLPGDKLPTEQKLVDQFGVSRTVIREAVSNLKADGLLASRQGSGVFVLEPPAQVIALLNENPQTIAEVIEALELRLAVEVGAAELAATRASPAQEASIHAAFSAFKQKVKSGKNSEKEDFAFHVAIAEAANNSKFVKFLTLIGSNAIPRSKLRKAANLPLDTDIEQQILIEHKAIMHAIDNQDAKAAQLAMHVHLSHGIKRYRKLARIVQNV